MGLSMRHHSTPAHVGSTVPSARQSHAALAGRQAAGGSVRAAGGSVRAHHIPEVDGEPAAVVGLMPREHYYSARELPGDPQVMEVSDGASFHSLGGRLAGGGEAARKGVVEMKKRLYDVKDACASLGSEVTRVEREVGSRQRARAVIMRRIQQVLRDVNSAKEDVAQKLAECEKLNAEEREACSLLSSKLERCRVLVSTAGSIIEADIFQRVEDMRMNFEQEKRQHDRMRKDLHKIPQLSPSRPGPASWFSPLLAFISLIAWVLNKVRGKPTVAGQGKPDAKDVLDEAPSPLWREESLFANPRGRGGNGISRSLRQGNSIGAAASEDDDIEEEGDEHDT